MKFNKKIIILLIFFLSTDTKSSQENYETEYNQLQEKSVDKDSYIKLRKRGLQSNDINAFKENIFNGEIHFNFTEKLNRLFISYKEKEKIQENIEFSNNLDSEGRELYTNNSHSSKAYIAYDAAAAWLPRPKHFLILGDISFRWMLDSISKSSKCTNKYKFAYEGKEKIIKFYETGFAFADILGMNEFKKTPMYKQSREKMACLDLLVSHYSSSAAKSCVTPEKLKFCLGDPLTLDSMP